MNELAIPDPRTTPVPFGWCETVAEPVLEQTEDWSALDDAEGELGAFASWCLAHGLDATEFYKAMRVIEKRRAEVRHAEPVPKATWWAWRQIRDNWDWLRPILFAATTPNHASQRWLLKLIDERAGVVRELPEGDAEGDGWRLLAGTLDRLADLGPESVDLIVTDPPYPKDDLPLWSELGAWAAKVLRPRGLLFGYTGQIFLPAVLRRLEESLTYGWTFALMLPGSGSRIMGRHVIQGWKPVVAFSVKTWPVGEWADDVLISPERDKELYAWQQNAEPVKRLIERYSAPGAVVLDPFAGTGTFGVAALATGRTFVGVEPDKDRFETARERLAG